MNFDIGMLKKDDKIIQILNDFVVKEEACNMSCDYCLTEGANLKEKHQFERNDGKLNFKLSELKDELNYKEGYELKESIDKVVASYNKHFDAPIFKISGGEVLLVKNITDLLKQQSEIYEVVQVLTNGSLINEELVQQFASIPNINIQFSLDGHTIEMNSCRVKSQAQHQKLLSALDLLVANGITTEIYCVLSKVNINALPSFAQYLIDRYGSKVHLAFFPVRQGAAKHFLPEAGKLEGLKALIDNYGTYESILPPLPYIEEMYDYLMTRRRKSRCYVPMSMFQDFDDGIVTPCPNCWTVKTGNLCEDCFQVISSMGENKIYKLMTSKPPKTPFCLKCFTDYHLFNLYFNGDISIDDITKNRPLLKGPRVKSRLVELKNAFETLFQPEK